MKQIMSRDINLGVLFIISFSITLILGFFKWPFLIVAALSIISYVMLNKKKLGCPNCGGSENLDRLMYATKHVYHCRHCGVRIIVK